MQRTYTLRDAPDHLKTQEMCNVAMCEDPAVIFLIPDCFKTKDMCIKTLEVGLWILYDIPDNLKTEEMCNKAVENDSSSLQFVPDWFVIKQQLDKWYDDDDDMIEWNKGYKKHKAQKAKIKGELLPIA